MRPVGSRHSGVASTAVPEPTRRELQMLAQARKHLRKNGHVATVLVVDGFKRSGVVGFGDFAPGNAGRELLREAGKACKKHLPWRVWFLSDSWIKEFRETDLSPEEFERNYQVGDLAKDVTASEALVLVVQTRDLVTRVIVQKYEGDKDSGFKFEKPYLRTQEQTGPSPIISAFWEGLAA